MTLGALICCAAFGACANAMSLSDLSSTVNSAKSVSKAVSTPAPAPTQNAAPAKTTASAAPTYGNWTSQTSIQRVNTIGQKLLQDNKIPIKVDFNVMETDDINAFANTEKEIYVYTGLLNYVSDDAELAAVIAHEIGHIVNSHTTRGAVLNAATSTALANVKMNQYAKMGANAAQQVTMLKLSRTDEYEADVTGVDILYNAGYNPLAMISLLYKISGNYADFLSDHPSGDKRTMYCYDYIMYAYPEMANAGYDSIAFKNFLTYATPIVQARNADPQALSDYKSEQESLRSKRLAKIEKYKNANQNSGWDNSYQIMKGASSLYNMMGK